jgi:hypothetical protein
MKKLRLSAMFVIMMAISLIFSITASAGGTVSYGGTYYSTLVPGQQQADVWGLPNASTHGTSVHVTTSVANTLRLHFYWSYNNTSIYLGSNTVSSTDYYSGAAYYQPGALITVVELIGSTSQSYSISFNPTP